MQIPSYISKRILTVGLAYKNHRGGIGGVIDTYSRYFPNFKFISTYEPQEYKFNIILYFLISCFKLIRLLSSDKEIRVVHIHGAAKGSFYRKCIISILSKYIFRRKVIYHSHGSEFKVFYLQSNSVVKFLIRLFLEDVDLIICLSKQWELFFTQNFSVNDIVVLENIIEEPQANLIQYHQQIDLTKLLFLGAIGKRKGVFDLLEALNDNKSSLEGRLQLIIGGNGEVEKLKIFVKNNQLEKLVKFEGWVTGEKKYNLLKESNLYILPSYNEGLPLSILEAMSYGLPIISTAVGGTPEVVREGINGFLIKPGDKVAIYKSIIRFLDDPLLLTRMGVSSQNIVQPYYSKNVIPKLQKIYEKLLVEDL